MAKILRPEGESAQTNTEQSFYGNAYSNLHQNGTQRRPDGSYVHLDQRQRDDHTYETMNMQELTALIQRRQIEYINERSKAQSIEDNQARLDFTRDMLKTMAKPFKNGVSTNAIFQALGTYMIMSYVHPDIKSDIPTAFGTMLEPYAAKLAAINPKFQNFYEKCASVSRGGRLPYTPETAAMDYVALSLKYYNDIREPGLSEQAKDAIREQFANDKDALESAIERDDLDMNDVTIMQNRIVANLVLNSPNARKCFDLFGPDANRFEMIKADSIYTQNNGYIIPDTGFDIDGSGAHLFKVREPYSYQSYHDMLFDCLKDTYGDTLNQKRTGAGLSDESKYQMYEASVMFNAMRDDGFTDEQINSMLKWVEKDCAKYYESQQQMQGQNQQRSHDESENEQPDKSDESPSMRFIGVIPQICDKSEMSKSMGSDEPDASDSQSELPVMNMGTQDGDAKGTLPYFNTFVLQPVIDSDFDFDTSLSSADKDALAKLVHDAGYGSDVSELRKQIDDKTPTKFCNDFINFMRDDMAAGKELSTEQKITCDLVRCMQCTAQPVYLLNDGLISDASLIATRTMNGAVQLGQEGAHVKDFVHTYVGANCFADESCMISKAKMLSDSGCPLYVCMNSKLDNCSIQGDGVILNTNVKNTSISGTFDPYKMRKANGMKGKDIVQYNTLEVTSKSKDSYYSQPSDTVPEKYLQSLRAYRYELQQKYRASQLEKQGYATTKQTMSEIDRALSSQDKEEQNKFAYKELIARRTENFNYADEIEAAARVAADKTPGSEDDAKAKKVAENLDLNGAKNVRDLLRQSEQFMRQSIQESEMQK